ncbi:YbjN domain-containing protein [Brachybacterium sp. EF45031]|nr:YbjN domain-containing protein [Brachybacterium sillae]
MHEQELAAPVTLQRVADCLRQHGFAFVEDADHPDVLRARFDDYRFQFAVVGEGAALQTRGRWNHSLDISRKVEMLKVCNEWNMNRIWPKVYVRRESESSVGLYGEVAADMQAGVTDKQLDRAIECGLTTVIAFFHEVEERLGAEVAELGD